MRPESQAAQLCSCGELMTLDKQNPRDPRYRCGKCGHNRLAWMELPDVKERMRASPVTGSKA